VRGAEIFFAVLAVTVGVWIIANFLMGWIT
jgi:hypothetical protein